ncbi:transposase [Kitasatospora purpeofusca]|uniref:transposase n=1 Tax=Kitasatospora purpeofusca TaxID=67352 RepID=UPI002A5A45CA|nr:transposase [Kitasatospora purpeofusca]MDY0811251.1 transposase [Kitasatospora purpeofusca]
MLSVVNADGSTESGSLIDEIVREGARRMPAAALEAEINQYIAQLAAEADERGHRLVVCNGRHQPRTVATPAGPVEVTAPRVNDRRVDEETGERKRFSSKILAPWCRKSPKVSEVLPLLYLHGLSSGEFAPALEQFLGSATGLSPATVTRPTRQRGEDHVTSQVRDLSDRDFVYVWAAGVHPKVRLGQAHSCVLVLLGNVTNALPKSAQPGALKAMQETYAEDRAHAEKAIAPFARTYRAKFPKVVAKITDYAEELLAFYDFPAEHWIHPRTTNPIEPTFSTVKLRTKVTRDAGSPAAALAMVFKLVESAPARWRAITGAHLVALVRSGARLEHGILVERTEVAA